MSTDTTPAHHDLVAEMVRLLHRAGERVVGRTTLPGLQPIVLVPDHQPLRGSENEEGAA